MLRDMFAEYCATRSIEMRNRIVMENYGLAVNIARKMHYKLNRVVPMDDLIAEACIGLIRAVETFDTTRNVRFSTLAVPIMFRQMVRYAVYNELNRKKFQTTSYNRENDDGESWLKNLVDEYSVSPDTMAAGNELTNTLKSRLNPKYQRIFMRLLDGWTEEEAAAPESLGRGSGWLVKKAVRRHISELRGGID